MSGENKTNVITIAEYFYRQSVRAGQDFDEDMPLAERMLLTKARIEPDYYRAKAVWGAVEEVAAVPLLSEVMECFEPICHANAWLVEECHAVPSNKYALGSKLLALTVGWEASKLDKATWLLACKQDTRKFGFSKIVACASHMSSNHA